MLNLENFQQNLSKICSNFEDKKFLLAVSGGADSMVILKMFQVRNLKFEVAHINYKLRGEDSDLDQKTIEDFCEKNNIKLHIYEVSEDEKPQNSIQLWARNLRYEFFFKILKEENLDFIVTAHHLNDDMETFFINLSRGSGIRGLSGIPQNENQILRPLFSFTKEEIYDFAKENSVEFREDLSNQKNDYLRNSFRNKIIPEIKAAAPNFERGFQDSLNYLKNANHFILNEIEKAFVSILIKKNDEEIVLDKEKLLALDGFLIQEIILKFGFRGEEIQKIISAENGKMFRSKSHEIFVKKADIICKTRKSV